MGVKQCICCLGPAPSFAPVPSPSPVPTPTPAPSPRVPNVRFSVRFRVLIIGRANAGKTSILKRVCDTTDNPEIHSSNPSGARSQVCAPSHANWCFQSHHGPSRLNSTPQERLDTHILSVKADHEDPVRSAAFTTLRMNLSSLTTVDTFSTTPADLSPAVETS